MPLQGVRGELLLPAGGVEEEDVLRQMVIRDEDVVQLVVRGLPGDLQLAPWIWHARLLAACSVAVLSAAPSGACPSQVAGMLLRGLGGGDDERFSLGDEPTGQQPLGEYIWLRSLPPGCPWALLAAPLGEHSVGH